MKLKFAALGLNLFALSILIFLAISTSPYMTDNRCKKYIITNKDKLIKEHNDLATVELAILKPNIKFYHYYTDITLRLLYSESDSTYQIIFWGDRNSWKWDFKRDKLVLVDIRYNRYKGKNVDLDLQIFNILKSNEGK
jgi:hypothetical protein